MCTARLCDVEAIRRAPWVKDAGLITGSVRGLIWSTRSARLEAAHEKPKAVDLSLPGKIDGLHLQEWLGNLDSNQD